MIENINWLALGGFVLLAIERVVYYSSKYRRRNNPGTTDGFLKLLEKHEKTDEKRHDEMRKDIRDINRELKEHGEALARLKSPGR